VIYADSSAGSTGLQLLYQAIGAEICGHIWTDKILWDMLH
jgi:hypothetical protein